MQEMGFEKHICEFVLRKTSCVQFALDELLTGNLSKSSSKVQL